MLFYAQRAETIENHISQLINGEQYACIINFRCNAFLKLKAKKSEIKIDKNCMKIIHEKMEGLSFERGHRKVFLV